jgi:hypothetical protein
MWDEVVMSSDLLPHPDLKNPAMLAEWDRGS